MKRITPNYTVKDLVVYTPTSLSLGYRFTDWLRTHYVITHHMRTILVASLLGDGSIQRVPGSHYPRYALNQSLKNFRYLWFIYGELGALCNSMPFIGTGVRNGIRNFTVRLLTRSLADLTDIYSMFYVIRDGKKVKVVNVPELLLYLNPLALAIWAMEDGKKVGYGFGLCTQSFT